MKESQSIYKEWFQNKLRDRLWDKNISNPQGKNELTDQ